MEFLAFFGYVLVCVLLIERPWRSVPVHIVVERVSREPAESQTGESSSDIQQEVSAVEPQPANGQAAQLTPEQILQVHEAGRQLGRKQAFIQACNPSLN